jgi:uncharacterized BrkB/YihY/UPF0761 family membrane protein
MGYIIYFLVGVFIVMWGISVYFIQTKKMNAKDWFNWTLGLPRGSVRALIAFIILLLLLYPALNNHPLPDIPEWLVGILGTVIGFYFGAATAKGPPTVSDTTQKPPTGSGTDNADNSEEEQTK